MKFGLHVPNFGALSDPRAVADLAARAEAAGWDGFFPWDHVTFLPPPLQHPVPIWGATERAAGRPVRRAAGSTAYSRSACVLTTCLACANISRHRADGLAGCDFVAAGTDDWRSWRDVGATWWLRVLPWSRPIAESFSIAESGPPAR